MSWLNIPVGIIERDIEVTEALYVQGQFAVLYTRATRWITTRYVGGNYQAAVAKRDELKALYPGTGYLAPTVETEIAAASGGQYHLIATVKTIRAWESQA